MDLQRIGDMEKILKECTEATGGLEKQLDRMEQLKDPMTRLFAYYGSEDWYEDREGEIPKDVPAGVLSEDQVYDQIMAIRDSAFRMMELSTDILKNRI